VIVAITRDSILQSIKRAHRKLVLETHPDRVQGAAAGETKATVQKRFMRIQEAYEMLMGRRHVHMGSQEDQDGWNFHDFFWSFNYHRRKKEGARTRPPPPAGSWKGQMENLKRRAAARKWKQARKKASEGWLGNIMNMKGRGESPARPEAEGGSTANSTSGAHARGTTPIVSSQLEGLKRKAHLKKTILDDE
jgi:curved DNA-binding protein CbpA